MLIGIKELLKDAEEKKYAICGFDTFNSAVVSALIHAAEEERSPIVIQALSTSLSSFGIFEFSTLVKSCAEKTDVPVVLHLDHGRDISEIRQALDCGFTSLMIDASKKPFEENVALTKSVVEMVREMKDICVEGQVGVIFSSEAGAEEMEDSLTDPHEAKRFVEETGIGVLAVAIGSVHSSRKPITELDYARLEKIKEMTAIPLSLHGGTGVSEEAMRRAISLGISRIDIGTAIYRAFTRAISDCLAEDANCLPQTYLKEAEASSCEVARRYLKICGSAGKA